MNGSIQPLITLTINNECLTVVSLSGEEEISQPFHFTIVCLVEMNCDPVIYQNKPALLHFTFPDHDQQRKVAGIVTAIKTALADAMGRQSITFTLQPQLIKLMRSYGQEVFVNQTVIDIIKHLLQKSSYNEKQYQFCLVEDQQEKPYCSCHYAKGNTQSLYYWMQCLLSREGINYFFTADNNHQEKIIFTDTNAYYPYINQVVRYIQPTSLYPLQEKEMLLGFSHLAEYRHYLPYRYTVMGHDINFPNKPINADYINPINYGDSEVWDKVFYAEAVLNQHEAEKLSRLYAECAAVESYNLVGRSNIPFLSAGRCIALDASRWQRHMKGDYLIIKICHHAEQSVENQGKNGLIYNNQVTLLPVKTVYRSSVLPLIQAPSVSISHIEGNDEMPYLDIHGRYSVKHHFDRSRQASPPLARSGFYAGPSNNRHKNPETGGHTPLRHGAEILVGHIHEDFNRPIIIGTLPNANKPSPVNQENKTQNRLVSNTGNELLMDDTQNNNHIILQTANGIQTLMLKASKTSSYVTVRANQGAINWQAKKTIYQQAASNWNEQVGADNIYVAGKHYHVQSQNIIHQAAKHYWLQGKEGLYFQTEQRITLHSGQQFIVKAGKQINLLSEQGNITFQVDKGSAVFRAEKGIDVISDGEGVIMLGNKKSGIEITHDSVIFYGDQIRINCKNEVILAGEISFYDS